MTGLIATAPADFSQRPAILAVFAITYIGIAMGHVPGLKLNRVGIALLGAIAMMIFGGIGTKNVISYINWPTIFCSSDFLFSRRNSVSRDSMTWWPTASPRGSDTLRAFCSF